MSEKQNLDGTIVLPVRGSITKYHPYIAYCLPGGRPGASFDFDPALIFMAEKKGELLKAKMDQMDSRWGRFNNLLDVWLGPAVEDPTDNDRYKYAAQDVGDERVKLLQNGIFGVHLPINSGGGIITGEQHYLETIRHLKTRGSSTTSYGFREVASAASSVWGAAQRRLTTEKTEHLWHRKAFTIPLLKAMEMVRERVFGLTQKERMEIIEHFRECRDDVQSYYLLKIDQSPEGEFIEYGTNVHAMGLAHECLEDSEALNLRLSQNTGMSPQATQRLILD